MNRGRKENEVKAKKQERLVAVLTIYGAAEMSTRARNQLSRWIMRQGCDLVYEGKNYSKRFRARYFATQAPRP
jgi:hypothetical protein